MSRLVLLNRLEVLKDVLAKSHHEDIVAGVKLPLQLKGHDEPVPYEHPHRELAVNFVTDVHRRNPYEGARMSEKYLGIGSGGKVLHPNALPPHKRTKYGDMEDSPVKKAVDVMPASTSTPIVVANPGSTTSEPRIVQNPAVMNPYPSQTMSKCGSQVNKILSSMLSRPKGK